MPCYTFDVLGVLHQDTHAFEIRIRMDCGNLKIAAVMFSELLRRTFPYPDSFIPTTARQKGSRAGVLDALALGLMALKQAHAFPLP